MGKGKGSRSLVLAMCVILFSLIFLSFAEGADVKRVTVNGKGTRDGNSWENAYSLQDFRAKHAIMPVGTEFWLASGVYAPALEGDRDVSFYLVSGTSIYGGFKGDETSRSQRDPQANTTVLTGDIDGNDTTDEGITTTINGNNSYTVVLTQDTDATAILDGVVITGGDASGSGPLTRENGGGLICVNSTATVRNCSFSVNRAVKNGGAAGIQTGSPIFENCTFSGNSSGEAGGALGVSEASPAFTNCTFSGNSSGEEGGAVVVETASPAFTNCTFSANTSGESGGGMYNYDSSSPTVTGCTFSGNAAGKNGGGMANVTGCHPVVTNCTFSGNIAHTARGGGMSNSDGGLGLPSNPVLMNCTFTGNSAPGTNEGDGMYNFDTSSPTVTNSIFWGNGGSEIENETTAAPVVSYCVVKGGFTAGTDIYTGDPKLGSLADNGGMTLTHAIAAGSSAIDNGTSAGAPSTDQREVSRPQGNGYDIGAYELIVPSSGSGGGCAIGAVSLPGVLLLIIPFLFLARK